MNRIINPTTGEPFDLEPVVEAAERAAAEYGANGANGASLGLVDLKFLGATSSSDTYLHALATTRQDPDVRARDPLSNHAWVFAAAMAIATSALQARFCVWRETEETVRRRRLDAEGFGARNWTPPRGRRRRAAARYLSRSVSSRFFGFRKAIEQADAHPLNDVLVRPNPIQDFGQFWQTIHLWLAVRGEVFWILTDEDGGPFMPMAGSVPAMIWPVGPDSMSPIFETPAGGQLVKWEYRPPTWAPGGGGRNVIYLDLDEVVHFAFANPSNPTTGMSPLTAAAGAVQQDMMVGQFNRSMLRNNGVPEGVITSPSGIDPDRQKELKQAWKERHEGPDNAGRTAFLSGGLAYMPIGFSPRDIQFMDQLKMDREQILSTMGVPPSILGLTEFTNYATAMSQARRFWDNRVLPILRMEEATVDGSALFRDTGDNVFPMFDVTMVEELRVGISEKIDQAIALAKEELHVPPRVAFEIVGLEVGEYEGDDVALVGAMKVPAADAAEGMDVPGGDPPPPPPADDDDDDEDDTDDDDQDQDDEPSDAGPAPVPGESSLAIRSEKIRRRNRRRRWQAYVDMMGPHEERQRAAYASWVAWMKRTTLERFDAAALDARGLWRKDVIDLTAVLPDPDESRSELRRRSRPSYAAGLESVYDFSADEVGGIHVVAIDDERVLTFFDTRQSHFSGTTTGTLIRRVRDTLSTGIQNGETIQELRARIGESYSIAGSPHKTLQIARTETAGFMNGVRDELFGASGVELLDWIDAADENTRDNHRTYGRHQPEPRGFNYLTLVVAVSTGMLRFPGDTMAPASEVVNCRCMHGPTS